MTILVWFRQDLRLEDHPALYVACQEKVPIIPIFIYSPEEDGAAKLGAASRWWLDGSLRALDASLLSLKSRLIIRRGNYAAVLANLVQEAKATAVFWNRRYEPGAKEIDAAVTAELSKINCKSENFTGGLLYEPWDIQTKTQTPYRVFTPYWRACMESAAALEPCRSPRELPSPKTWPKTLKIVDLVLKPKIPWDEGLAATWVPGEASAKKTLQAFGRTSVMNYVSHRDLPGLDGTSRLAPHLAFGEISPRQIWQKLTADKQSKSTKDAEGANAYLRQIGWREFAYHLLHHYPHTVSEPLRPEFKDYPWQDRSDWLQLWQKGLTGFPIVDAGMRQLWRTGWMHNRVRMIVGSFLVKDLLLPWQLGAQWFWDTLVDADLANNTLGWQWIAGCGADAAPYFRIYNPMGQGERHDPKGDYVRRWVPELSLLPDEWLQKPHEAPPEVLRRAGVKLGDNYPKPVVDHAQARIHALHGYKMMKEIASRT